MPIRPILTAAAALTIALGAAPALADNNKIPPGSPCAKGNGNPCNGNNGNAGAQGNAGHKSPPPIDIPLPPVSGGGAFVDQIGNSNIGTVLQTAPNAFARIAQDGDDNEADIAQRGSGTAYADARQTGSNNFTAVRQDGAGQNVSHVTQEGSNNWAWSNQRNDGAVHNGAILTQLGDRNDISLLQDGSDNRAKLTQNGNENGMTVAQTGNGNRLEWTQNGDGLRDLSIHQTGAQAMQITQTASGNGHGNGFGKGK